MQVNSRARDRTVIEENGRFLYGGFMSGVRMAGGGSGLMAGGTISGLDMSRVDVLNISGGRLEAVSVNGGIVAVTGAAVFAGAFRFNGTMTLNGTLTAEAGAGFEFMLSSAPNAVAMLSYIAKL